MNPFYKKRGILIFTRPSQKFCNILVTWSTIWQLQIIFAKVMKMTNQTRLWDANLTRCSPRVTCQTCLYGLEHKIGIHGFRPIWPCLIVKLLTTQAKFLQPSSYWTVINYIFTFHTKMFLLVSTSLWPSSNSESISSLIRPYYMFICIAFNLHIEWNNAQHVSTPITIILPIPEGTFHSLNYFGHVIYTPLAWCNGCPRRIWTRRHEFKSRTRLIAFHIALIPLGKVWIQIFSIQLWVNSRTD